MGDWLLNAARHLNLRKASLNILSATFSPVQLNIHPLVMNAKSLKEIIDKELMANGFEPDFIQEAGINFQFPDPNLYRTTIYCFPYLVDKEGKRYETVRILEEGLEPNFDPFEELNMLPARKASQKKMSIINKIRNLFR